MNLYARRFRRDPGVFLSSARVGGEGLAIAKSPSLSVDTAHARIGRPLTPMSVAGVNRRVVAIANKNEKQRRSSPVGAAERPKGAVW